MSRHLPKRSRTKQSKVKTVQRSDDELVKAKKRNTDVTGLHEIIEKPSTENLTPDVINSLQRQYGNHFVNTLIQKQTDTLISREEAEEDQEVVTATSKMPTKQKRAYKFLRKGGLKGARLRKITKIASPYKRCDTFNTNFGDMIKEFDLRDRDLQAVLDAFGVRVGIRGGKVDPKITKRLYGGKD